MNRFLITLFIIFATFTPAICASKYNAQLITIEEELYGINYSDQSDETRLARLEESVYGVVSKNNLATRMKKLSDDLSADVIKDKIKPCEDTFMEDESSEELASDETVRYPVLDRAETKLFSKTYEKDSLDNRIARIEKQLFNQTYLNDNYNARVERIKNNVFKEDYRIASENAHYDDIYNGSGMTSGDLSGLNRNLFTRKGQTSFSNQLANIENQMFGSSFDSDTEQQRIDRINSAYKAQNSIKKYDSNRFQQGLSTAMQIGAMLLMLVCMIL